MYRTKAHKEMPSLNIREMLFGLLGKVPTIVQGTFLERIAL